MTQEAAAWYAQAEKELSVLKVKRSVHTHVEFLCGMAVGAVLGTSLMTGLLLFTQGWCLR
jgi:hypothetical protein